MSTYCAALMGAAVMVARWQQTRAPSAALGAAFLAASDGGVIATEHLIKATKREYQKIGRLCTEADFAPYF
jgi:hypothetical protein